MSFLSGLKRVIAATSTGGLSLLAPPKTQETIGSAFAIGSAVVAGGALAGGATLGGAGATGGNILTGGSQLLATGAGKLLSAVGIGGAGAPPDAGSPPSGSGIIDTAQGLLHKLSGFAPFGPSSGQQTVPNPMGGGLQTQMAQQRIPLSGGFMPASFTTGGPSTGDDLFSGMGTGLPIPGGSGMVPTGAPDFPGGMAMPIPAAGGLVTRASARGIAALAARALSLTRLIGPVGAAAALGLGAADLARLIFHALTHHRRRRHRGISGRDMRIARRTIGKVERAHAQLAHAYHRAAMRSSRTTRSRPGRGQVIEMIKQ